MAEWLEILNCGAESRHTLTWASPSSNWKTLSYESGKDKARKKRDGLCYGHEFQGVGSLACQSFVTKHS